MFKNRKILLIITFLILFFNIYSNSYATETIYEDLSFYYNGNRYTISNPAIYSSEFAQRYGIVLLNNGELRFYYSNNPNATFIGSYNEDGSINIDHSYQFYYGEIVNNEWKYINYVRSGDYITFDGVLIYTNQDVVYDEEGNIFFQIAPLSHLAQIVEEAEMEITLLEIVKTIPLILVVVVSLVGLRKGLQILLTLLHRCLIILIHLVKNLF